MLPEVVRESLHAHLRCVIMAPQQDLADGYGHVQMPVALARRYPNAPAERRWQWVFP